VGKPEQEAEYQVGVKYDDQTVRQMAGSFNGWSRAQMWAGNPPLSIKLNGGYSRETSFHITLSKRNPVAIFQ
jgi:hypothetical protein